MEFRETGTGSFLRFGHLVKVGWIRSSLVMVKDISRCFERKERLARDSLAGSFVPDLEKLGNEHTATQWRSYASLTREESDGYLCAVDRTFRVERKKEREREHSFRVCLNVSFAGSMRNARFTHSRTNRLSFIVRFCILPFPSWQCFPWKIYGKQASSALNPIDGTRPTATTQYFTADPSHFDLAIFSSFLLFLFYSYLLPCSRGK